MGALDWNKIVHQDQGWRLISCIWLHAGLIHLVVNMLSLLFIGIRLEQQFGFGKLLRKFHHTPKSFQPFIFSVKCSNHSSFTVI
jgi:membrane associated rhomboid family serine protease